MSSTFILEELDDETRNYLIAARNWRGRGLPGVYAPRKNSWPGVGCLVGLVLVIGTPILTMTNVSDVVYNDPDRVALLQTAGLLLGGWMCAAAFRVWSRGKGADVRTAGYWVYADARHLYEAAGEQVTVTPLADLQGAKYRHTYSENKYQKTAVTVMFAGKRTRSVTIADEEAAEALVGFLNYLVFAAGPDGAGRAALAPADLGALGAEVARTEDEPADAAGNPDPGRVKLAWNHPVPETPERARPATPAVIPYVVLLLAGVGCYFLMRAVDIPVRDTTIFEAVTGDPVEPRYLRAYLADERNTLHRAEVTDKLASFYDPVIAALRRQGAPANDGLIRVLESVRTAEQAVVSVRVTETKSPAGGEAGAAVRTKALRESLARRVALALSPISRPIVIPAGMVINPQPPPVSEQLLTFVEAPEDAANPHFDIRYAFEPTGKGEYRVSGQILVRVSVEDAPVARGEVTLPRAYAAGQEDTAVQNLVAEFVKQMTGSPGNETPQPNNPDGF